MPTEIGTKSMPSISVGQSKVKRPSPVLTSMPTIPSSRPTSAIASALRIEPLAITTTPIRPSVIKAQYSGAPKDFPTSASGGAARQMTSVDTTPANSETSAAVVSAGPARPCCAIA